MSKPHESVAQRVLLEEFVFKVCGKSLHIALLLHWHLRGYMSSSVNIVPPSTLPARPLSPDAATSLIDNDTDAASVPAGVDMNVRNDVSADTPSLRRKDNYRCNVARRLMLHLEYAMRGNTVGQPQQQHDNPNPSDAAISTGGQGGGGRNRRCKSKRAARQKLVHLTTHSNLCHQHRCPRPHFLRPRVLPHNLHSLHFLH